MTANVREMKTGRVDTPDIYRPDVDRGWAWVAMTCTYLGMLLISTTHYMVGVLYIALLERYGESEAKTSFVGAVSLGLLCFAAPIGGALNNRFSCRVSIVLGGSLTTLGFVSSAFVPDLNWMIVTSGAIVGTGYGISSSGLICVCGFYFKKWRDQVLSFAFVGSGTAMFISAPLGLYLVNTYGLSMTLVILGCLQSQMCVLGMLCKPSVIETEVHAAKKKCVSDKTQNMSKAYVDFELLLRKSYLLFLISTISWTFGLTVAIMHLPNYLKTKGGSSSDIGWLMTTFSLATVVGRLCASLTVNKLDDKSLHAHAFILGVSGIVTSLYVLYSTVPGGAYIFAIQLGIFTGWPNATMTPLSLRFVGLSKLSEAHGFSFFFCGIGVSIGPVVTGYLYTTTKSYETSFIAAGLVLVAGCICTIGSLCCGTNVAEKGLAIVVEPEPCEEDEIPGSGKPLLVLDSCSKTETNGFKTQGESLC